MDGFDFRAIKLKQCINCFSVSQNEHYVAAVGDQIVIYQKNNWSVRCVIPSKVFSHPYSLQFLSDHIFVVKNNRAQYMIYDVLKNEILWKFKVRGYDSIDISMILSLDGKEIYDGLTHRNSVPCCSQLVIFPEARRYEIRDLSETFLQNNNWSDTDVPSSFRLKKGLDQRMYLLKTYNYSRISQESFTMEYVLFHKPLDAQSLWEPVKQWRFEDPIDFKSNFDGLFSIRSERKLPIYFDEKYIVWNDYDCENWQTGEHLSFDEQDRLTTPIRMRRKYYPQHDTDFWMVDIGFSVQFRQYATWEKLPAFYAVEQSVNKGFCDLAILDNKGKTLIGTMSVLFLCDLQITK